MTVSRFQKQLLADSIFAIHLIVVLIVVFGWLLPSIRWVYISLVAISLISELYLGYCILSKWEFDLRKQLHPDIDYTYEFTTYYTRHITEGHIRPVFYQVCATVFLFASLVVAITDRVLE